MENKQSYMPFFFDWCVPFSLLSGDECKELILAMANYYQNGIEIKEFSGMAGMAAAFIFPQIDRTKAVSTARAESGAKGGQANRSKSKQTEATNTNTNTSTNTSTITNTNTNADASSDPEPDRESRFALFWKKYPKKQNKVATRKAWDKLDPDEALLNRILDAIDRQMQTSAWMSEGGKYIPSPSSWLSQCRFEDETTVTIAPPANSQGTFSTDEFLEAALRRTMEMAKQQQEGG